MFRTFSPDANTNPYTIPESRLTESATFVECIRNSNFCGQQNRILTEAAFDTIRPEAPNPTVLSRHTSTQPNASGDVQFLTRQGVCD